MNVLRKFAALIVALVGIGSLVHAEPRIALVVGNSKYSAVTALDNPVSDAALITKTLEQQGFTVTLLTDATQRTLNSSIAQ